MGEPDPLPPIPDLEVDALGLLCPLPVIRCAAAARRLGAGRVILLRSDDEGILQDLPAWCGGNGHEILGIEPELSSRSPGRVAYRCLVRTGPAS